VKDILRRLTRKGDFGVLPIIPSPQDREYRIRSQLKAGMIGGREVLGFYAWRTHRVVKIQECPLLHPLANRILGGLQGWLGWRTGPRLKNADLQVSPSESQGVVCLKIEGPIDPKMGEEICQNIGGIKGLVLEGKEKVYRGESALRYEWPEVCGGRKLTIHTSGESFSQVNPYQNWKMMQTVVEWADLTGRERVLDLFCGSGNLTLPLAQRAGKVWGVDRDRLAVDQAAGNAGANGLSNCTFLEADAEEGIRRAGKEARGVELVVLDPPRIGARGVLDLLASLGPRKIIYVSCEPPALGRDLARLMALGYNVERVQPLDMFPQTYHIEVIAELSTLSGQHSAKDKLLRVKANP
jgi:23S rRNA (uracil1939-C5)-methyltransferase